MATSDHQQAYSAREFARAYHIDRSVVLDAIRSADLIAYRRGKRRWLIFRSDAEDWIRRHAVRSTDHARARVDEVLEREARMSG
jgi:hypothetical protein